MVSCHSLICNLVVILCTYCTYLLITVNITYVQKTGVKYDNNGRNIYVFPVTVQQWNLNKQCTDIH